MSSNPDQSLSEGKTIETDLDRLVGREFSSGNRHKIQLRKESWVPWLTLTDAWNSANAYNLALSSALAYKNANKRDDFFYEGLADKESSKSEIELGGNSLVEGGSRKPLTRSVREEHRFRNVSNWNVEGTLLGFEGTDLQAFTASSADRVLIAIRGTENLPEGTQDWIQNLKASTVSFRESATSAPGRDGNMQVHEGFYQAFRDFKPALERYLSEHIQAEDGTQKPVFVGGHSLGGAVGLLTAAYIRTNITDQVVLNTYGMPRVAELPFVKHYSLQGPEPIFHQRHVHHKDPVPALPPPGIELNFGAGTAAALAYFTVSGGLAAAGGLGAFLDDYDEKPFVHHGSLVYLPSVQQGHSFPMPNAEPEDLRIDDLGDLAMELWEADGLVEQSSHLVGDHFTTTYIEVIRRRLDAEITNYLEATANGKRAQMLSEHSAKYDQLTDDIQTIRDEIATLRQHREETIDPEEESKTEAKIEKKQTELGKALRKRRTFTPPSPQTYQSFLLQTPEEHIPESPRKTLQRFQESGTDA